ncbi:MAG: hypothetical protein H6684_00575 [Deltaproteobacteria bacterium]|nr:hypothetical protein [bacterium]MCB9476067.1 hypothetical protein [Deltaproteobacteria bacterium]MCB9478243.1 hypothetical protein [Deltaproteobacteria bacterium]MCB9487204.1 hypothetical protein [Deltaproteobacteria bacterium]
MRSLPYIILAAAVLLILWAGMAAATGPDETPIPSATADQGAMPDGMPIAKATPVPDHTPRPTPPVEPPTPIPTPDP